MKYFLYNDFSDGGNGKENATKKLEEVKDTIGEVKLVSLVDLDLKTFIPFLNEDDECYIFGGDGTLNHFVNDLGDLSLKGKFFLCPSGTGNDFLNDLKKNDPSIEGKDFIEIGQYLTNLPLCEVNGRKYRFLNGIGYGIDGECCVVADKKRAEGVKDINYSNITIDLLLHSYVPRKATVVVDGGEPVVLDKVYLASAMHGGFYGGGMNIAPDQIRNKGELSLVIIHGKGKLGTLLMFPKIFSGKHIKYKKNVYIAKGKTIEVSFDEPCGLQVDGEVENDVTSYKAYID